MRRGIKRPALVLWALVLLLSLGITPAAAAPSGRATLAGSVPPWATSANFKSSSNTSDSVGFRVYLGWRGIDVPDCSLSNMAPFFTDPQVIGDVEQHVAAVLDHVAKSMSRFVRVTRGLLSESPAVGKKSA